MSSVWSYGYIAPGPTPSSSSFTLFTHHGTHYDNFSGRTFEGVYSWRLALPANTPIGTDFGLMVSKNLTSRRIDKWSPGEVVLHPGVGGYYGVVRWKAPEDGEIYSSQLNDWLRPHKFSENVMVSHGDPIDFIVGQGTDNQIWGDSTAFEVRIAKVR